MWLRGVNWAQIVRQIALRQLFEIAHLPRSVVPNVGLFCCENDEKEQKVTPDVTREVHFEVWFVASSVGHPPVFTPSKSDKRLIFGRILNTDG